MRASLARRGTRDMNTVRTSAGSPPAFGLLLRRYRVAAGLTQEALAERAHLSLRGISDLERGVNRTPRRDTVRLLADALHLAARDRAVFEGAARRHGALSAPVPTCGPAPSAAGAAPPFVGRTRELALLDCHLAGEGPPLLLMAGEPGIGKTRLLSEAAQRAPCHGWQVLQGGCQRRGGQEPYTPVLEALDRYIQGQTPLCLRTELRGCAWLVRLLPELAAGPIEPLPAWTLAPEQERRLLFKAVQCFLANVAGPAGTLLLLDDLQWAGSDALDLLAVLVRSAGDVPLRIIGAYRDTEVQSEDTLSASLADLARERLVMQRMLAPLAPVEAARLLDDLLAGADDAVVPQSQRGQVLRRTGGVPFFLVSCAERLRQGDLAGSGVVRTRVWDEMPWDVTRSIRQRIADLPQVGRDVLGTAAVIGRVVPRAALTDTVGHSEEMVLVALEAACHARLLIETDERTYQFAHDVIREVVEADLGAARRAVLHRRIAVVLERTSGELPVEALAYHYAHSEDRTKAVAYLERAGDKARAQAAHAAAADYYRALVECLDAMGRSLEAAAAREKLGAVLATLAQYDAALEVYGQAAKTYRGAGDLETESLARVSAAMGNVYSGKAMPDEGVQLLEPLLLRLEERGHVRGLAVLYPTMARLLLDRGRYAEAMAMGERAIALARAVGEDRLWAAAALWRGEALHKLGRVDEALRVTEEAISLAEAMGDLYTLGMGLMNVSCQYEDRGEFEQSRRYGERALAIAARSGDPLLLALMTTRRGMTAFYAGDWRAARTHFEEAVALDRQVGPSWVSACCLLDLGRLELAEGAWAEATRWLEESLTIAERSDDLFMLYELHRALAEHDLLLGQAERARARLLPVLYHLPRVNWVIPPVLARLAWAQVELGELHEAEATVAQAIRGAQAMTYRVALVDALRVQAMVFTRQHRWIAAAQSLEEGLTLAKRMPYPYAEARLLHVYGEMHAQRGEPPRARERLEAALAIFRRLGARKDVEHVEQVIANLHHP
jgi:tetratricopeptide (TPR) repeat protein/DNA-binding XRE family transcriptional regulator